ncbi:ribonuclease III [Endomicrobium proavitum]|uniref:Ribonuclease 3 n=1 Tax=Endomicrobium proavitum TaxID=1408281 RepID=A0A0G3WIL9_9BACT|nr:ribonuclease III [Endomicrobium proavitum]AKL97735.1 Ribonuclease 3 [Endomicrobium proavitum]
MLNNSLEKLQKVIEYKFNNLEVLITALTHKSYASDAGSKNCNERMEFLGDSILSAVVVEVLYNTFPDESEGKLSQYKSQIVSAANLSRWAKLIDLGSFIFLGKGEDTPTARNRESLLCDAFEAIVGALYIDGGLEAAKKFVSKFFDFNLAQGVEITDYKSRLQESVQSEYKRLPQYEILKEFGPDHNKQFEAGVYVKNKLLGTGAGRTKKEAQQAAAKKAIENTKKTEK